MQVGWTVRVILALAATLWTPGPTGAASPEALDQEAVAALSRLCLTAPGAQRLAAQAKGLLIFPSGVKAGFLVGAEDGLGVLRKQGQTVGYYNLIVGSAGGPASGRDLEYALLFMTGGALDAFESSQRYEVGPSVVIVDQGVAQTLPTTSAPAAVYAFVIGPEGLTAGHGLPGATIVREWSVGRWAASRRGQEWVAAGTGAAQEDETLSGPGYHCGSRLR